VGVQWNAHEARDALHRAGYFHYQADALNVFHPAVEDEYAAVDYRGKDDKILTTLELDGLFAMEPSRFTTTKHEMVTN
jgi:hypothetical protein